MKAAVLAIAIAASSVPTNPQVEAELRAQVADRFSAVITLTLQNHSGRDLCFFQSLGMPELRAQDGSSIAIRRPKSEEYQVEPQWTRTNEMQVLWKDAGKESFDYYIALGDQPNVSGTLFSSGDLKKLSEVSVDVTLFDCIDFHRLQHGDPVTSNIKRMTIHATAKPLFDVYLTPAPSPP